MKYLRVVPFLFIPACTTNSLSNISEASSSETLDAGIDSSSVPAKALHCPEDMVEIKGNYCPQVEQTCLEYDEKTINANGKVRCLRFAPSKCLSKVKKQVDYCMDTYEYPNKKDAIPDVMISWMDTKRLCEAQGKRLCRDTEWEFACEGEEMLPYPYGLERGTNKCNIDKPWIPFDGQKLMNPKTRQAEVDRLSQRVPSGSMPECKSPFGVYDMTGNVDESVINSSGQPYKSGEKGGHWAWGARNRCRPMTTVHDEGFIFYEIGGRCCKDVK